MRNINEILNSEQEVFRCFGDSMKNMMRVACPGIIQNFDSDTQTVTVQLTLREEIVNPDQSKEWVTIPILLDVPIVLPRAGGYCITMPITAGDECLVIFADMCIDAWYSYGGVQNQIEKRRHDLSDAFAILGTWSQPRKLKNYSMEACQVRNENGSAFIEIKGSDINIKANNINLNGNVMINNINFNEHKHKLGDKDTTGPI